MENKVKNFLSKVSSKVSGEDKKFLSQLWIWFIGLLLIVSLTLYLTSWDDKDKKKEIINPTLKAQELQLKENRLFQEKLDLDKRIVDFYKDEKKPFIDEVQWMIDGISENKIDTSLLQNIK